MRRSIGSSGSTGCGLLDDELFDELLLLELLLEVLETLVVVELLVNVETLELLVLDEELSGVETLEPLEPLPEKLLS